MSSNSDAVAGTPLFTKTMVVLTGMMGLGAFGAYVGAGITSGGLLLVLAIGWLILTFGVMFSLFAAKSDSTKLPLAAILTTAWTFLAGLVTGPALAMYVKELGPNMVFGAFVGTAGVMAVCGAFGMLSGLNFSKLESVLGLALWGLIIVGLFGLFFAFSSSFNIVYCSIGLLVFAGYFIVDFWRVKEMSHENDWPTAALLAMMLFLDFLNFLLYLLRLLSELNKKD